MFHSKPTRAEREKWKAMGPETIVVHFFQRGKTCPSISPFVLKLETYLRMANIKYEAETKNYVGPKGKVPWVTIGEKDMGDSQLIIEHLEETRGKLNGNLTDEQAAVERALQVTLDDRFYWLVGLDFYVINKSEDFFEILDVPQIPKFLRGQFKKYCAKVTKKQTFAHGVGRHSPEELKELTLADLKAFSNYLGDKQFLFGDTPTAADCCLFGHVGLAYFQNKDGNYIRDAIKNDYKNLLAFIERVREKYWSDWEECCAKPKDGESKS